MGIAVSILSAVLKSVAGDKLGSGLVKEIADISIDGISEKGINEIADFINKGKAKIDSIFSRENMKSMGISEDHIDYVVAEIKDLMVKIDITDELFRQCKYNSMILKDFMWNEYVARKNRSNYIESESEIKACLFAVAEVLNKVMRDSEDFSDKILIQISNAVDDTNVELQNISDYLNNNFGKLNADNQTILEILQMVLEQNQEDSVKNKEKRQPVKSRTQEYADKWNANMFLNDFDEWDENAGVNVKLSDVYIDEHLPHFKWQNNMSISNNLDILLSKYIVENREAKMLLILGQPGIGKSTLITWIVIRFNKCVDNILVYKFADDLKNVDWQKSNISREILETLNLTYNELEGKTLILDGFDEVNVGVDRKRVLDNLYGELIYKKNIKKFSLIITCRENYIQKFERVNCQYLVLQSWNEYQIKSFCSVFQNKNKSSISNETVERIIGNKAVLGVPLILYMVLSLNISINTEGSIVDVYDKIFSLEGGIYDRCINNKKFAANHRISEIKNYIHQISREIAMWMFENNPDNAYIPQAEYQKICVNIIKKNKLENETLKQDFLIGNFFKLVKHCEGVETEELYFVHRSIYEYFVVETMYNSIKDSIKNLSEEDKEVMAANIPFYLKQGKVTYTIAQYFKYKVKKVYISFNDIKKIKFYEWWQSSINKMLEFGMFYYSGRNIKEYKNILNMEINCFLNIVIILKFLIEMEIQYVTSNINTDNLMRYIKYYFTECEVKHIKIDLSNMFLREINLEGVNLQNADLRDADLRGAVLHGANLSFADFTSTVLVGADLSEADLSGAEMKGAKIEKININGANLRDTLFDEKQVKYLKTKSFGRKFDLRVIRVYTNDMEIISYEEYRRKK